MRKRKVVKSFVFTALLFFGIVPVFAASESGQECRELLVTKCQICHYLERVCSKVGKKSERRWKATLTRMVKRRGAELREEEQKSLLKCLVNADPGILKECDKDNSRQP
jgi:hypothetical protein